LVPRMADTAELATHLPRHSAIKFCALVLNQKGFDRALAAGFKRVEFVIGVSESFHLRNCNRGTAESLKDLEEIARIAKREGVAIRVGLATSFHCPFQGRTATASVAQKARAVRATGDWRLVLADTDGRAFPDQIRDVVTALREDSGVPSSDLILHLHDT